MDTQQARHAYPELVVGGVDKEWNVLSDRPRCDWSICVQITFDAGPPHYPARSRVKLRVHPATEAAFTALAFVFSHHGYLFGESAGGTVSCRKITGGTKTSPHTHGIALDINPSKNPYGSSKPDELDEPQWRQLIADVKAIRTVDGHRVFRWGGDWSNDDDMHFEPTQCTRPQLERGIDWVTVRGAQPQTPQEDEMTTAEFMSQMTRERVNALCEAKAGGSWVINPTNNDRLKEKAHWLGLLATPDAAGWADFHKAVLAAGQVNAALGATIGLGVLQVSMTGKATPI